ncbi:hypothetical protein [Cupriavidus metallidurans]|uniref:hypothetical protein n=1 Tax=Cupriavidus metallidurans TaxID=119219 RepID=UPI000CE009CD|nr:hypothetical protein [Cupriavidus metallidurans]AVA38349.1 hypothetical protein C3Z06_32615 [Cupriavidus metallidurans]
MNTKSTLRVALAIVSLSCALNAYADLLADPLGPLPKDVSRAAKASVASATAPVAKTAPAPAPTPAPVPVPAPAVTQAPTAAPVASVTPPPSSAPAPTSASTTAVYERPVFTNANRETFRELDQWRTKNALDGEKVKNAELNAKLANQGTGAGQNGSSVPTVAPYQVLSVDGLDDDLMALVTLANGTTFKARTGLSIPGLGKVMSIARDDVLVMTKTGPRHLDFAPKTSFAGMR